VLDGHEIDVEKWGRNFTGTGKLDITKMLSGQIPLMNFLSLGKTPNLYKKLLPASGSLLVCPRRLGWVSDLLAAHPARGSHVANVLLLQGRIQTSLRRDQSSTALPCFIISNLSVTVFGAGFPGR